MKMGHILSQPSEVFLYLYSSFKVIYKACRNRVERLFGQQQTMTRKLDRLQCNENATPQWQVINMVSTCFNAGSQRSDKHTQYIVEIRWTMLILHDITVVCQFLTDRTWEEITSAGLRWVLAVPVQQMALGHGLSCCESRKLQPWPAFSGAFAQASAWKKGRLRWPTFSLTGGRWPSERNVGRLEPSFEINEMGLRNTSKYYVYWYRGCKEARYFAAVCLCLCRWRFGLDSEPPSNLNLPLWACPKGYPEPSTPQSCKGGSLARTPTWPEHFWQSTEI